MKSTASLLLAAWVLMVPFSVYGAESDVGRAYFDFGVFAYEDADYEKAEAHLKKALSENPDMAGAHHYLAKTYIKTTRLADAEHHINRAREIDPTLHGLAFDNALLLYKIGEIEAAGDEFAAVSRREPNNVLAAYYAGVCRFKEKRHDAAIPFFENAAALSPTIRANGFYYLGVCYAETGKPAAAAKKFEYVEENGETEFLRTNARKWLQIVRRRQKTEKPYRIYLSAAIQFDDNVRLVSEDASFDEAAGGDEADAKVETFAMGRFHFIDKKPVTIGAGLTLYNTSHFDLDEYDLTAILPKGYGAYHLGPLSAALTYEPAVFRISGEHYLTRHRLAPALTWRPLSPLALRAIYRYDDNTYFANDGKDGHTHGGFAEALYGFGPAGGYVSTKIGVESNHAAHPDYDYGQWSADLRASFSLGFGTVVTLYGKYNDRNYDNTDRDFDVTRDDTKYHGAISVSKTLFTHWFQIGAEYAYTKNDSNIDAYDYERNLATFSVAADF